MSPEWSRRQLIKAAAALPLAAVLPTLPVPAFSSSARSRLDLVKIDAIPPALQSYIDRGDVAGMVSMIWHRGEMVQVNALGWRNIETRSPMWPDTLFRLASMSKPVTSAAVLTLLDEGKLTLSDPVRKWIPELANRRVLRKPGGPIEDTVPAHREITVEDLLTHRSGLGYGFISVGPIAQAYQAAVGR